jgi:death-on-curing protein
MKMTSWVNCLPNSVVQFLSVDEVLEIHTALIDRFGGADGLRDRGLLESALYRPQSGYYADLVEMAAAMFESLINNHPCIDDNRRVAFFASDVFLRLNGYKIAVDSKIAYDSLMGLFASNTCDLEHLRPWIRSATIKTKRNP